MWKYCVKVKCLVNMFTLYLVSSALTSCMGGVCVERVHFVFSQQCKYVLHGWGMC